MFLRDLSWLCIYYEVASYVASRIVDVHVQFTIKFAVPKAWPSIEQGLIVNEEVTTHLS